MESGLIGGIGSYVVLCVLEECRVDFEFVLIYCYDLEVGIVVE